MPYGKFKSVEEVATKFDIEVADRTVFISERELIVADVLRCMVARKLQDETSYITKFAVGDAIIRPILDIIAKNYHLKVWSHVSYNVDEEKG
jgi:hypothetical protein